jgi:hypothetical protein
MELYNYMTSSWVAYDDVSLTLVNAYDTYNLTYDEENRLKEVKKNNNVLETFVYDAGGSRVMSILEGAPNDTITVYVGNYYELDTVGGSTTVRKYYYAGGALHANAVG